MVVYFNNVQMCCVLSRIPWASKKYTLFKNIYKSVCVIHHQFWRGFPTLNGRDGFFFLEKNVASTCEKLRTVNPSGNGLRHGYTNNQYHARLIRD